MKELKYDNFFAECITDAYESYDKECEVKIAIDILPKDFNERFHQNINDYDYDCYMLVTLNKQLKNISYLVTECKIFDGSIISLPSNYSAQEKEIIRKVALQKVREEMFKKF